MLAVKTTAMIFFFGSLNKKKNIPFFVYIKFVTLADTNSITPNQKMHIIQIFSHRFLFLFLALTNQPKPG